jgi:hypothetical protein
LKADYYREAADGFEQQLKRALEESIRTADEEESARQHSERASRTSASSACAAEPSLREMFRAAQGCRSPRLPRSDSSFILYPGTTQEDFHSGTTQENFLPVRKTPEADEIEKLKRDLKLAEVRFEEMQTYMSWKLEAARSETRKYMDLHQLVLDRNSTLQRKLEDFLAESS